MSDGKKKILLVEDDPITSRMYERKLVHDNFEVTIRNDGVSAMQWLKQNKPDLILLDIMLPRMNGFEVLDSIQADVNLAKIPVIIVSNLAQQEDVDRAKSSGAVAYLVKGETSLEKAAEIIREVAEKSGS